MKKLAILVSTIALLGLTGCVGPSGYYYDGHYYKTCINEPVRHCHHHHKHCYKHRHKHCHKHCHKHKHHKHCHYRHHHHHHAY